MLLTAEEIAKLTAKVRPGAQRRVLDALGNPHKTRPDGSLVVLRVAVEVALGVARATPVQSRPRLNLPEVRPRARKA